MRRKRQFTVLIAMMIVLISSVPIFANGEQEGKSDIVELNFIEVGVSAERTEFFNTVIAEYETANPGIKINLITPPYEQSENKITMMLNAKQPLDIFELRGDNLQRYVNNKQVASLEAFMENWEHKDDFMLQSYKAARSIDDTAYMMTMLFWAKALFVRTDILKEHNIEIPQTMEELYNAAVALTDPSKNQFGYVVRGKNLAWKVSADSICLANVPNIDPNNYYMTTDGNFVYSTDEGKAGLQRYVDLVRNASPKDGINWGYGEQVNAFTSGVAFLIQDPDVIPAADEQLGLDKYTIAPIPVGEKTGTVYRDLAFNGLGITSYSEHQQEAWNFLSYLISPEVNAEFCKEWYSLPVFYSSFINDPFFSSGHFGVWKDMFNDTDIYKPVSYPIGSEKLAGWEPFQQQYMQRLLLGEATVEETVAKWAEYWAE